MDAAESRRRAFLAATAWLAICVTGCRSSGPAAPAPPPPAPPAEAPAAEPPASEAPPVAEAAPPEPPPESSPVESARRDIVIQHPVEATVAEPPPSLYEASLRARAERERAAEQGRASRVVTDATLKEQAARGQITEGDPAPEEEEPPLPAVPEVEPTAGSEGLLTATEVAESPETYWRRRTRDARWRWRLAVEQAAELEQKVDELRWEFYATDDPFYRDSQIKPAWDHALAELEFTRGNAALERHNLDATLDEGRRAGALPGWLREGLELEPTPEQLEGRGVAPEDPIGEPIEAQEPDGRSP